MIRKDVKMTPRELCVDVTGGKKIHPEDYDYAIGTKRNGNPAGRDPTIGCYK